MGTNAHKSKEQSSCNRAVRVTKAAVTSGAGFQQVEFGAKGHVQISNSRTVHAQSARWHGNVQDSKDKNVRRKKGKPVQRSTVDRFPLSAEHLVTRFLLLFIGIWGRQRAHLFFMSKQVGNRTEVFLSCNQMISVF